MRPFGELISFEEALAIVMNAAVAVDRTERMPIADADGRVVAEDVAAGVDVPPFDRAAMDGYAVVAADVVEACATTPTVLTCLGELFPGVTTNLVVHAGECVAIATGAPLPAGADAVVMVEATERTGDRVSITLPMRTGQNVARRGSDMAQSETVAHRGRLLNPAGIGALAAIGVTEIAVYAKPSVALISTGDELLAPGQPLGPGQIYNVNRFTLQALVARHGGLAEPLGKAADTHASLRALLDEAVSKYDIVVFSGGSSVGNRDLLVDVVRERGEVLFHGIAIKPGKPTLFARIGSTHVFGMPGNPASCLSNAYALLVPHLRAAARLHARQSDTRTLPLARSIKSVPGKRQFYTVRIVDGRAEPAFKTSGDVTSMALADGIIEIEEDTLALGAGTPVTVTLF